MQYVDVWKRKAFFKAWTVCSSRKSYSRFWWFVIWQNWQMFININESSCSKFTSIRLSLTVSVHYCLSNQKFERLVGLDKKVTVSIHIHTIIMPRRNKASWRHFIQEMHCQDIGFLPKCSRTFIEISEFAKIRESYKSLKRELVSI